MKRIGNLYSKVYKLDNLILAERNARKGKTKKPDVILFDKSKLLHLTNLRQVLINRQVFKV